jgi:hypothetical protein
MNGQSKRKWTVFFLIKSVEGSIGDAIEMINAIRRDVDACDYISVIFCLQVLKKNVPAIFSGDPNEIVKNDKLDRTTVFCSLTKSDGQNVQFKSDLKLIAEEDAFDITNPKCIQEFFKEKILDNNRAQRYMLFTWDHGSGYGIFRDVPETPLVKILDGAIELVPARNMSLPTPAIVSNNIQNKNAIDQDEVLTMDELATVIDQDKVLTMDELAAAIGQAFGEEKIELVVMMNCYMQFFDAGYALRKNIKYLIAPESYIFFKGYNYEFIFRKLAREPDLSSRKLAKHIVDSFELKVYDDYFVGISAKATTALFANDVTYYAELADYIDQLAGALEQELNKNKPEIIMARVNTPPVSGASHLVDFFYLLQNLQKSLGNNWQQELVEELLLLKKKTIIAQYIGFDFGNYVGSANPSGFSIYFPIRLFGQIASREAFNLFQGTSFKLDKNWHKLVMKFV